MMWKYYRPFILLATAYGCGLGLFIYASASVIYWINPLSQWRVLLILMIFGSIGFNIIGIQLARDVCARVRAGNAQSGNK